MNGSSKTTKEGHQKSTAVEGSERSSSGANASSPWQYLTIQREMEDDRVGKFFERSNLRGKANAKGKKGDSFLAPAHGDCILPSAEEGE